MRLLTVRAYPVHSPLLQVKTQRQTLTGHRSVSDYRPEAFLARLVATLACTAARFSAVARTLGACSHHQYYLQGLYLGR